MRGSPRRSRGRAALVVGLVLIGAVVVLAPSRAASPPSGVVSRWHHSVRWTGETLGMTAGVVTDCAVELAPTCDEFALRIGRLGRYRPDVVVSVVAADPSDIIALSVHRSDGSVVASSGGRPASSQTLRLRKPRPGNYTVWVEAIVTVAGGGAYRGSASAVGPKAGTEIDLSQECLAGEVPIILGMADDGRLVDLDVLVVLDGVTERYARRFFSVVSRPYRELGIRVVPSFTTMRRPFVGTETISLLDQLRRRFPDGKVPARYDVVELLTAKDITALGQPNVAGQADCIGGIAYDQRSYNVSEAGIGDEPIAVGPFTFDRHIAAKITAHEIGHLLGGQHHYANCVEGIDPDEELNGDTSPCTLMFNAASGVSLHFGTLNGMYARAYAFKYAAPNDAANRARRS